MSQQKWNEIDQYIGGICGTSDSVLEKALGDSAAAGLPAINVSPNQGKFLHLLARIQGAKRFWRSARSVDTAPSGWPALPTGGRMITLEFEPKHAEVARVNIANAGLSDRVSIRIGPALDTLPTLVSEAPFDFVFIDADKVSTADYFQWALRLTKPGSVIIVDNVVRDGEITNPNSADPGVAGVRRFNDLLAKETRVSSTALQTVGSKGYDGFAILVVNGKDQPMRLLITADLHYNHPRSKALAEQLIDQMNTDGGDVLVVVGDTAVADGDSLEKCLARFTFNGPKLFVAGNHELWTRGDDSYAIFTEQLPARVRNLGWHWLEAEPFIAGDVAIIGSVGWYDFSFAAPELGIPRRFYEAKVSPGAARRFSQFAPLFENTDDILPMAHEVIARWNDGKFIKLHRNDEDFLQEILDRLMNQLVSVMDKRRVVACVHHLPFRALLPPPHSAQWDFAKAFLGSERIGQVLLAFQNVYDVFCGHSHLAMTTNIGSLQAVNIGSGYRWKTYKVLEVG